MDILGYTIDTALEWVFTLAILVLLLFITFYVGRFLLRYTSGMMGGFIFLVIGMGMILGPSFYLISTENVPSFRMMLSAFSILSGCAAVLVGAFTMTNFRNF